MKFLAQNFFEKGPRDKFKAIDTLYGSLAQFFTFFKGQKKEKFYFKKMHFHRLGLGHYIFKF
jgi:hypothetical protein